MKTSPLRLIVILTLSGSAAASAAPVVTYVGQVGAGEAQAWRTSSVAKTYSIGGSNIYGSAGYVAFGTKTDTTGGSNVFVPLPTNTYYFPDLPASNTQVSFPAWIDASTNSGASSVVGNQGTGKYIFNFGGAFNSDPNTYDGGPYPEINDPQNSLANYRVGVLTTDGGLANVNINMVTLRFASAGTFRLGAFVNTLGAAADNMDLIGIWNGVSGTTAALNRTAESLAIFDVTAAANDEIVLYGSIGATAGRGNLSYVSLDVVPEPGTFVLAMLGGFFVFFASRRLARKEGGAP